jgi:autophagy-related protein 5
LPKIHSFFSSSLIDSSVPVNYGWFSFQDVPLKLHYPVGLLYDIYSGFDPTHSTDDLGESVDTLKEGEGHESKRLAAIDKGDLPWKLTIHFSDWPRDLFATVHDINLTMYDSWNNSVKEVSSLKASRIGTNSRAGRFSTNWNGEGSYDIERK